MSVLSKETDLLERILAECEDDHVGLWSILRQVRDAHYADPRSVTLGLIHFLLTTGKVEAGIPDAQAGFQAWRDSPEETMRKIEAAWPVSGSDPDLGDIVWFTAPSRP